MGISIRIAIGFILLILIWRITLKELKSLSFREKCSLLAGLTIFSLGTFCNWLVVAANDWRMPVDTSYLSPDQLATYTYLTGDTSLQFLADRYHMFGMIASIGDMILTVGIVIMLFCLGRLIFFDKKEG